MNYLLKEAAVEAMEFHGALDMLQLHWLRLDTDGFDFRRVGQTLQIYSADSAGRGHPTAVAAKGDYLVKGFDIVYVVPAKVFNKFYVKQD